jgi:acyl carrier protein
MHQLKDKEQVIRLLKEQIGSVVNINPDSIDEELNFLKFGITSIQTIMMVNKLKKSLEIDLNPIAMFEYKNIAELADYIDDCISECAN